MVQARESMVQKPMSPSPGGVWAKQTLLLILTLTCGCQATQPGRDTTTAPLPQQDIGTEQPPSETQQPIQPITSEATLALVEAGQQARANGNPQQAVGHIERAIRIEPHNPRLWLELASLHLEMAQPENAIEYARKSITLAGNSRSDVRNGWLLIAAAKESMGQTREAKQIRDEWKTYPG